MNEKFEVLSLHDVNFKKEGSEQPIEGVQLLLIHESANPKWHGHEIVKCWIDISSPLYPSVMELRHGDQVEVQWNRYGKANAIYKV